MAKQKKPDIKNLYYITHINNISSILENGIYSHRHVEESKIKYKAIYDSEIVNNRKDKKAPNGKSLWEFANVYFQARNPMLFRVIHINNEKETEKITVLALKPDILKHQGVYITDGNAANAATEFYSYEDGIKVISDNWTIINSEGWKDADGSKRKIMAECLAPEKIPPVYIDSIYVSKHRVAEAIKKIIPLNSLPNLSIIPAPRLFFLPKSYHRITKYLSLAEGDMFFSSMQTLTISVNTVGIMGKGLASRAKYQFPDVFVAYQDACRKKQLRMSQPFLYKREGSFDNELIDEPGTISTPNAIKWFLLFATKQHWRDKSRLSEIEKGLQWLVKNYKAQKIQSLAMPALGCGLGQLDWKDVGPLMCHYLNQLEIPVIIYLPREKEIPEAFLSKDYLLSDNSSSVSSTM